MLDLIISKAVDIYETTVKDVGLSDHLCIFFGTSVSLITETESISEEQ